MRSELERRVKARLQLIDFVRYTTPRWSAGKIHRAICEQAERVVDGEIDRLLLLCPPQHGKSEIISRNLPAYMLGRDPTRDIISASATADLASEFGRDVRNKVNGEEYRRVFKDVRLAQDSQAAGRWSTNHGGSYYAVGVGGQLFGRGGLAIVDDPFKSWADAQSELSRNRVWDWYRGTLYNRIRPGQPIIVIQHRMHEDDLAGRLIRAMQDGGDRWEIVELPADLEDPPWPEVYTSDYLRQIKANTAPMQWQALYMQDPAPDEGIYFKREWFWRYSNVPAVKKYITADFAVTDKAEADDPDYTEIGVHGVALEDGASKVYLCIDGWSGQRSPETWVEEYFNLVARHKPMCEFSEAGVIRRAIEGQLARRRKERRAFGRIEWFSHIGDKSANARALQSMASMGLIGLPNTEYGDYVLEQLIKFPAGKYDDAVDMCALMARAIDEAHPQLMAPAVVDNPETDVWGRPRQANMSWKTL